MTRLDDLDRRLIALLTEDGRRPVAGLARHLQVARSTIQERMERLERAGVIAGYTVRLGPETARRTVRAHVSLVVDGRRSAAAVTALRAVDEVVQILAVSGEVDLVVLVECADVGRLDQVLDRMAGIPGVQRTTTAMVLSCRLDRPRPVPPHP